jgi:Arc/MetJ family transcription regulator
MLESHAMHRTSIELDERLVREAVKLTGLTRTKEVVNYALSELVRSLRKKSILKLEGKIKWTGNLDEMRQSRV